MCHRVINGPGAAPQCYYCGGNAQAAAAGGSVLWKDSLLDEVQGLVETSPCRCWPILTPPILSLRAGQVLLTSMESHQEELWY